MSHSVADRRASFPLRNRHRAVTTGTGRLVVMVVLAGVPVMIEGSFRIGTPELEEPVRVRHVGAAAIDGRR